MLYVYGIVDSCDFDVLRGEGHEGSDVVSVPAGGLAAAVSGLPVCPIKATRQSVWRHEQVLRRLMGDHAVLPLRFGTMCREADALRDCLLHSADGFVNDLDRVRGKVEIALRIVDDDRGRESSARCLDFTGTPVGRGTAYLRARQQRQYSLTAKERDGKRLEETLRQHLGSGVTDLVFTLPQEEVPGFRISCLVDRDLVTSFADSLEKFREDHPQFAVTSTGPWAPYSFVSPHGLPGGQ